LDLGDFLDGMGTNDVLYKLDLLGAELSQEVCVGLERCEVVFSGSALVGAEGDTCLVQLGKGFGDCLDSSIVQDLMCRWV
jgi:hypothetical protein